MHKKTTNMSESVVKNIVKRTIMASIPFLLASFFIYQIKNVPLQCTTLNMNYNFKIKNWEGIKLPDYNKQALSNLATDEIIFMKYFKDHNKEVLLYIGYYTSLAKADFSHAPEVCFIGQGWIITNEEKKIIKINQHIIKAKSLIITKGNEKKLVLYWYQNPFGSHDNLLFQKLHLLITKIRYGKEKNAFIRISTPVNGDAKKAWNTITEFLNDFYPALLRYLSAHT